MDQTHQLVDTPRHGLGIDMKHAYAAVSSYIEWRRLMYHNMGPASWAATLEIQVAGAILHAAC